MEIWNEPNFTLSFQPGPDPELYGQMYREARATMRDVDPEIVTIVGGLANETTPILELETFLDRMGEPETIDAIAMHTYGVTPEMTVSGVIRLRAWMDAHGLQDRLIYFNEWGASTRGFDGLTYSGGELIEGDRAALFSEVASQLARSDCGLAQVTPYTWETNYTAQDFEDWVGIARTGASTVLSPTAVAYRDMIERLRGQQLPLAPRAAVHLCNRPAPDRDGDRVEDQHDYAPVNPAVVDAPTASPPSSYEVPMLRGDLRPGGLITASSGTWDGSPHPTFVVERWGHCDANLAGCNTIAGATDWQIVPDSSITGRRLRVVVRATNAHGSATAASAGDAAPAPVAPPTIAGRPRVNETLYASRGEWTVFPAPSYWYQWFTCNSNGTGCVPVNGATNYWWKIPPTALGRLVYVTVTAENVWGAYTQVSARLGPVSLL